MTRFDLDLWSHGVVKGGNRLEEWEDSASHSVQGARFAIADGATTAFRAGAWSDCLTRGWLADPIGVDDEAGWDGWIERRAQEWRSELDVGRELPYYVVAAAERGSFATFLGVEVDTADSPRWRAVAVGDSCLFHVRADRLLRAFPLDDPDAFGSHPDLVHTGSGGGTASADATLRAGGDLRQGDVLILATDALAEWAMRTALDHPAVWKHLREVSGDGLERLVGEMRRRGLLGNDDVTLVRCGVCPRGGTP
jgi:hypothetical protein